MLQFGQRKMHGKRLIGAICFAMLFLFCLCRFSFASAQSSGTCGQYSTGEQNMTWTLDDEGTLTISGTGKMVSYPSFRSDIATIKKVIVEAGVESIGSSAFYNAPALTEVILPEGLLTIEDSAFSHTKALEHITLPESLTEIRYSAFYSSGLKEIRLPHGLTSIGGSAFRYAESLSRIEWPDALTSIGEFTFGYTAITELNLPGTLTSIGRRAFEFCQGLTNVELPSSLQEIGEEAFYACKSLKTISLPDSLQSIGEMAFGSCKQLEGIVIPEGIREIPAKCFQYCDSLKTVSLPDSLQTIEANAFYACYSLRGFTVPEGVTAIRSQAFGSNFRMGSIYLPGSVTEIADDAWLKDWELAEAGDAGYGATVYCYEFSYADGWATSHGFSVFYMDDKDPGEYTSITLPETLLIASGRTVSLDFHVFPDLSGHPKVWASSAPEIVSVNQQGVLISLQPGKADISLTVNGITAVCQVESVIPATSLSLPDVVYVPAKGSARLPLTILPEDAVTRLNYVTGDISYASVDENGLLSGLAIGQTTLTVTDTVSGESCSAQIQVTYPVDQVSFPKGKEVFRIGQEETLEATVQTRTLSFINQLVTFTSSHPEIATVDASGRVTPLQVGRTEITATANGKSGSVLTAVCKIVVLEPENDSRIISLTCSPQSPRAGDPVEFSWDVLSPDTNDRIVVSWQLNNQDGSSPSGQIDPAADQGTETIQTTVGGWLNASVEVWDQSGTLMGRQQIREEITEPSGVTLELSPSIPVSGEPLTVSWHLERTDLESVMITGQYWAGNLSKTAFQKTAYTDGSYTFVPNEGERLEIFVESYTGYSTIDDTFGPFILDENWQMEPLQVEITYSVSQTQTGSPISAHYKVTGGHPGKLEYAELHWISPAGRLHMRLVEDREGDWENYVPNYPGQYYLGMDIMDSEGWTAWDVSDPDQSVNVTGPDIVEPLTISFFSGKRNIDLSGDDYIEWDVRGGDRREWRLTVVHAETDDGIVLENEGEAFGNTNWWEMVAENPQQVENSRYLVVTLTPYDHNGAGQTAELRLPIVHYDRSREIRLPAALTRIEEEAFLQTNAAVISIPASVISIAENAFPDTVGLIVPAGSYAEKWAKEHYYSFRNE